MGGGEAKARSEELTRGLRKEFGLEQVEAEFVVLVGRNGGLCLAGQVAAWRRARKLAASPMTVSRWIGGLHDKLGAAFAVFPLQREGTRSVRVHQFVGRRLYRELEMEGSRWRRPAEKDATLVEIKRRLVRVGAVLARWWYPWLGSVEASVSWCDALGIDRAVLPQTRCVFRSKWIAHFGGSGSLIPVEVDHRFRPKWIAFGRSGSLPEEGDRPSPRNRESSSVA